MAVNPADNGREVCSADLIHEMLVEAVGPGNPMTEEAMATAGAKVGARVEDARRAIAEGGSENGRDMKAMAAVLLIDEEAGLFDGVA